MLAPVRRPASLAGDAVAMAEISDEELQAEYDAQFASVEPAQEFNASHILVETEEGRKGYVSADSVEPVR